MKEMKQKCNYNFDETNEKNNVIRMLMKQMKNNM